MRDGQSSIPGVFLRGAAIAFAVGFSVHALDHMRRGLATAPTRVVVIGTIQGVVAVLAIWMVLRRRERGTVAATLVGFGSALLFTSGHLLPISPDSYVAGPRDGVTWFSWMTAFAEIGAGITFGVAGLRNWRPRLRSVASGEMKQGGSERMPEDRRKEDVR